MSADVYMMFGMATRWKVVVECTDVYRVVILTPQSHSKQTFEINGCESHENCGLVGSGEVCGGVGMWVVR